MKSMRSGAAISRLQGQRVRCDERFDAARGLCRPREHEQMAAGHGLERRTRQARRDEVAVDHRHDRVVGGHQHQRGRVDPVQPVPARPAPQREHLVQVAALAGWGSAACTRSTSCPRRTRRPSQATGAAGRHRRQTGPTGRQRQRRAAPRVAQREFLCRRAAPRDADDVGDRDSQPVEQRLGQARDLAQPVRQQRGRRLADAGRVEGDHAGLPEAGDERGRRLEAGADAVEQQDRARGIGRAGVHDAQRLSADSDGLACASVRPGACPGRRLSPSRRRPSWHRAREPVVGHRQAATSAAAGAVLRAGFSR
jgi:hypothetical protein